MPSRSMAGTRRAYDSCAGCRHARLHHLSCPELHCTGTTYTHTDATPDKPAGYTVELCACENFIERKN